MARRGRGDQTFILLYYDSRVIASAIPDRQPAGAQPTHVPSDPCERPIGAALAVTGAATLAFGIAAEPLLRVAERASMPSG